MGVAFYRGAEACILVYDLTSGKSFENLGTWKSDFINKAGPRDPENFPFFVIGNKADKAKTDRKVNLEYVEAWRKHNNNVPYEETSALDGTNVDQAFTSVAKHLLK